jgi:glycosyltransferase involved in cell wall biosynthesis
MKVLMFGWEFPPHIAGGLGTACYGIVKGLAANGVHVIFLIPKTFGDEEHNFFEILDASQVEIDPRFSSFFNTHNVSFMEINSKLIPYVGLDDYYNLVNQMYSDSFEYNNDIKRKYQFAGGYGLNLMQEIEQFAVVATEVAKTKEFDIIHAHDWHTYKAGIAAKRQSGKPLVVHIHATEFDRSGENNINSFVYEIEREGMMTADAVFAVSEWTRRIVIEKYGISAEKVFVVHNALEKNTKDIERKKAVKEKIVTFLGRVTFQKGPEYFVETAKKVLEKDENVRFVIAGDGDMMPHIIDRVAELGISDRFHFTGFLRGDDINKMFGMSDVYVMPSISEPFGISPLEAMQAHVPVVISRQSGVSEVLQYAIKVDFWDINAMADAIYGILHYPALANFFSHKGNEDLKNLEWKNVGKRMLELYNNITKF